MSIRTEIRDKNGKPLGWIVEGNQIKQGYTYTKGYVGWYDKVSGITRKVNGELYSRDDDLRALVREEATN